MGLGFRPLMGPLAYLLGHPSAAFKRCEPIRRHDDDLEAFPAPNHLNSRHNLRRASDGRSNFPKHEGLKTAPQLRHNLEGLKTLIVRYREAWAFPAR